MKLIPLILILFYLLNCSSKPEKKDSPDSIPDRPSNTDEKKTGDTSTILGKVFSVSGKSVELQISSKDVKQGETLYILQDGKPVGTLQVTQTFHTKVKAKVIDSTVTIAKGMSFGRWMEGSKVAEVKEAKPAKIESDQSSNNFSESQGAMNWNDAKAKCASLGMRLPTRSELTLAYIAKETESWGKDGYTYWTSEEYSYSEDSAFFSSVDFGNVSFPHSKSNDNHVRCIR